ncbi:ABC transporter substrate-binding protein [Photobacterium phosphoreum]|uniref:ABC transporter substrate-binding protein n=1 Tax=Photobacterium phosphoreum TaxID=659 RepID=UPI0007F8E151|nr:ABC transporter substrate-binding protein [Photobacterium phosphoreum]MCD9463978.1 ABC transporter substrate-binding protein [Photobacterium phosphoreum]MCD9471296.1 ABC transporter substrate-binding protein [Photobacterium phosphoreum]MCD9506626.1 ABC transporter substrate-binding protein [Photobacterium phosphoreum]MCD9519193.1 ABC transporter substrate-binding protein [Photobacterium phosphoreum]OBU27661.1 ABC transporter substrate-binding protein [Photobacterium phosphoreum]
MKKSFQWVNIILILTLSPRLFAADRIITDDAGKNIILSAPITRIADGWFAHASLMMTLGAGNKIMATVNHPSSQPWMFKIQPSLNKALLINGRQFNAEALVTHQTELAFVVKGDPQIASLQRVGIPVIQVYFSTLSGLQQTLQLTAHVLGDKSSLQKATQYNQYLNQQLHRIGKKIVKLTADQRPTVVHISSLNPLKVDGKNTLINDWINIAGGRNVAAIDGNMQPISAEKLLAWQPDIIILAANAGNLLTCPNASLLAQLNAITTGNILRNPSGVFPWDRYGTESALQIQWAAKQFHPQLFATDNLVAITQAFYHQFFNYDLSEQQTKLILQGLPPLVNAK